MRKYIYMVGSSISDDLDTLDNMIVKSVHSLATSHGKAVERAKKEFIRKWEK